MVSVIAVNEIGESDESEPIEIIAENFVYPPGKPTLARNAENTSQTSVAVTITPPENDGGDSSLTY